MINKIDQVKPIFGEEERLSLDKYMSEGGWITEFKKTSELEDMISKYTKSKHCIMVNNGTVSLTLAAIACDITTNDEVIVPNYTMVATPNSVRLLGAKPIFVDVEPESLCIDLNEIKRNITKKTKAVFLVSSNGRYPSYNIEEIIQFCKLKNLSLIEDAAQSLGSFYPNGRHIGTMGRVGSFSFSPAKIISTGQGGALITDDDEIAKKLRYLKDFGRTKGGNDIHDYLGYNFKFTDIQAVVGIEQMKKLQYRRDKKKKIYSIYKEKLVSNDNFKILYNDIKNTTPWFIELIAKERDELKNFLENSNIGTRLMYPPINKQKSYDENKDLPVSNMIGRHGLWLPSSIDLTYEEISYITDKIKEFYK